MSDARIAKRRKPPMDRSCRMRSQPALTGGPGHHSVPSKQSLATFSSIPGKYLAISYFRVL